MTDKQKKLAALIASILALMGGVLLGVAPDGTPIIGDATTAITDTVPSTDTLPITDTTPGTTDTVPTDTVPTETEPPPTTDTTPTETEPPPTTDTTPTETEPPPPTTETEPPPPAWNVDQTTTWHCVTELGTADQPYRVRVHLEKDAVGAIQLDAGCTGYLYIDAYTPFADGVKVHRGSHDLVVQGLITCNGKRGIVHQDGIQAQDGDRVTFLGLRIDCPTGNNGGLWVEKKHPDPGEHLPTDIVCDGCEINNANAAIHVGANSIRSGARNSLLHQGTGDSAPADCRRIDPAAIDPVDENNTCVP